MKPYFVAREAEEDLRQIWRYLFTEAGIEIAILHSKRDVKRLLKTRPL